MAEDKVPSLNWNNHDELYETSFTHNSHGSFFASYNKCTHAVIVLVRGDLVRFQWSDHYGPAQTIVRRAFIEFFRTGNVRRRISRRNALGRI